MERRPLWQRVGIGLLTAAVIFVAYLEMSPDPLLAVLLACTAGVLTGLLLPERIGPRW